MAKHRHLVLRLSIVSVVAVGITLLIFASSQHRQSEVSKPLVTYSTDRPDESKENAKNYKWRGRSDEPKKIRIPEIGVDAFIQKAGVDQNNEIAVPDNIHLAGWFANSQKPGENGLSIIDGHVGSSTSHGIFSELSNISKGDMFEIELGNGSIMSYKVISVIQVPESKSEAHLFSQNLEVVSQVNLITCGGDYDDRSGRYEDRVIVSGELMQKT